VLLGIIHLRNAVTVMCGGNESGNHKVKLTVVEKVKSQSFKGAEADFIHVHYYIQKRAWMSKEIFRTWFHAFLKDRDYHRKQCYC
jgi:uncharacterized Rmd1/YagE family protein